MLDKSKGYYSSRIGFNLYKLTNNSYTVCIEIIWENDDIDTSSIDLRAISSIETIHNQKPRIYNTEKYARLICNFTKTQNIGNNYLYEDIVIKNKPGIVYIDKLSVYFIVYGVEGLHTDVYSTVYDNIFDISIFGNMDMKNLKIVNLGNAESDGDAVNLKQMNDKIIADLNVAQTTILNTIDNKIKLLQPKSYYNEVFSHFYDLTDASKFIMSDTYGAVVSGLNGNLVFNPTKLLADFDPKKGFMSGFQINLNENVTESDDWTIYMTFKYDYKLGDNKRIKIEFIDGSSFDFPWVKVEHK